MEIYQLKVFLEVAKRLSFSEAAEALNLTQPAVSTRIKQLEKELKIELFHRTGKRIRLTDVGEFLLEEGEKLIQQEAELTRRVLELGHAHRSQIRIACSPAIAEGWLPEFLFHARQHHPHLQICCRSFHSTHDLYQSLIHKDADVGLSEVRLEEYSPQIEAQIMDGIRYMVVLSRDHPLARRDLLCLRELLDQPWVLLTSDSFSSVMFEARLWELGLKCEDLPRLELVDNPRLMSRYLLQGQYIGFASSLDLQPERIAQQLVEIPLQEFPFESNLYLLTRRHDRFRPTHKLQALFPRTAPDPATRLPTFELLTPPPQISADSPLRLTIATQDRTIKNITAGLIMRQLGLLEHFLPRNGCYREAQYQIQWQEYLFGKPILDHLAQGKVDIAVLGDYPLLMAAAAEDGPNGSYLVSFVSSNPQGSGGAIVVPPHSAIHELDDLKGQDLKVVHHTSLYGIVLRSLHHRQLLDQVSLTDCSSPELDTLLRETGGKHPFAVSTQSWLRRPIELRRLVSADLSGLPNFNGVVVRKGFAEDHPEIVSAYLKALSAAQQWYASVPSAVAAVDRWLHLRHRTSTEILARHIGEADHVFYPELTLRPDWIEAHLTSLHSIPGHDHFRHIDLTRWIRTDFLAEAQQHRIYV